MSATTGLEVHKFGGAALADSIGFRHAAGLIAERARRLNPATVVAVSAMQGVTDAIVGAAVRAAAGDEFGALAQLDALRTRHVQVWEQAIEGACDTASDRATLSGLLDAAATALRAAALARHLPPGDLDALLAMGERLSAQIFVCALAARGVNAEVVDAAAVLHTDGRMGGAMPDVARSVGPVATAVAPLITAGVIPVVPGFIGRAPDGRVVTLGRGGTDLTATALAAALGASEVTLWKDVPGICTADPRVVPDARVIDELHVREAAELAYYGSKVLHPRVMVPLRGVGTILRIRPFADPEAPGTIVSVARPPLRQPVRALSLMRDQAVVTVTGSGMLGVPGIAARTFGALERGNISVSLISQASSEHSICLGVSSSQAEDARTRLEAEFAEERARGDVDAVEVRDATATVAVVGLGMAGTPGIAARLFHALARHEINVVAIAQGSSELNISIVVDDAAAEPAVRAVHDEFQLSKIGGGRPAPTSRAPSADVILLGVGRVGRALAELLVGEAAARAVRLVGLIDRSGFVFDPAGYSGARLAETLAAKAAGTQLADLPAGVRAGAAKSVAHMLTHALTRPVLVDLTADDTAPVLEYALQCGADLVLANKRPVGGARPAAERLFQLATAHGRRVLYEATVGAGLPLLDTVAKMVESGDVVRRIEGCPSGTLGYLFDQLGRGAAFSEALRGAMALGYTEPDPREDLSGADVARKALILGRLVGFEGDTDDIAVESLVPREAAAIPLDEYLAGVAAEDDAWRARVDAARARSAVLRYRATATREQVCVGLAEVPLGAPLAALAGTDNQFAFTTDRYTPNPLIITGPGAGPMVTAAGVLNDILKLAGSRA